MVIRSPKFATAQAQTRAAAAQRLARQHQHRRDRAGNPPPKEKPMHYCMRCGALIAVRWGQRPICPDCLAAEKAAEPKPEPTEEEPHASSTP